MGKNYTIRAETAEIVKDLSAGAAFRRTIRNAWRRLVWRTRVILHLRSR